MICAGLTTLIGFIHYRRPILAGPAPPSPGMAPTVIDVPTGSIDILNFRAMPTPNDAQQTPVEVSPDFSHVIRRGLVGLAAQSSCERKGKSGVHRRNVYKAEWRVMDDWAASD